MRDGAVKAPPTTCYPMVQVRDVHRTLDAGATQGKIVLLP